MNRPVITDAARKLSYRFMHAEAAWILSGRDDLAYLQPYAPRMAEFSDDGLSLYGAYGVRFKNQMMHLVDTLKRDPMSRQATITTWRQNPLPSKDIPCTVALTWQIRDGALNLHVYMRSSDAWLGFPYDVFSFSMMTTFICGMLNERSDPRYAEEYPLYPGTLYLTAASAHIYSHDVETAKELLDTNIGYTCRFTPIDLYLNGSAPGRLISTLDRAKDDRSAQWWRIET